MYSTNSKYKLVLLNNKFKIEYLYILSVSKFKNQTYYIKQTGLLWESSKHKNIMSTEKVQALEEENFY